MTEITENNRYIIDPVAFLAALFGAPILFTAATFWILLIPVGALIVGGLPYLFLGTPLLLIHLRRHPAVGSDIAWLAFLASAALVAAGTVVALLAPGADTPSILSLAMITLLMAIIFSTCWAATFAWLYKALARDFYLNAITI